jgi:CBS domain
MTPSQILAKPVADVMSSSVVSVRPETPCTAVAELLYNCAVGAVPVLDEDDQLLGIVSGADLLRQRLRLHGPPDIDSARPLGASQGGGQLAQDVMTRDVVASGSATTCSPRWPVACSAPRVMPSGCRCPTGPSR